jgi:hypothetical protein
MMRRKREEMRERDRDNAVASSERDRDRTADANERDRDRTATALERLRDRKAMRDAAMLLALPVAIIALIPSTIGLLLVSREINGKVKERERTTYAICKTAQTNRNAIRNAILGASDPLKLDPGDYGYHYARTHPIEAQNRSEEIARAIELSERTPPEGPLALFPPIICREPGGTPTTKTEEEP